MCLLKRLTDHRRWWLQRQARRAAFPQQSHTAAKKAKPSYKHFPTIRLDGLLDLFGRGGHDRISEAVRQMRDIAVEAGETVLMDLSDCRDLKACAVVKLHGEISFARSLSPKGVQGVKIRFPYNPRLRQFLRRMNFGKSDTSVPDCTVPGILPIYSNTDAASQVGPLLKHMNSTLFNNELLIDGIAWDSLHKAISEALLNVQMHAYPDSERSEHLGSIGRRWWVMAETIEDELYIVMLDKGIGIPASLKHGGLDFWEKVQRVASQVTPGMGGADSRLIHAAMTVGRSGLQLHGNGHGLNDIRGYVIDNPNGELHIFSNRGRYAFLGSKQTASLIEYDNSIHGTLIQWQVSLSREKSRAGETS